MLKGFMVPRSPSGHASIDPPPPWHYSGDVLAVEFWADPAVTTSILPEGLSPDRSTNGHAFAMFVDWQFTASDDEYLDPARYQYRKAFVLIDAALGSRPVTFCPFIYVDNDAALARGWAQGFPKKLGSIFQTRTYAAPSFAASPVKPGARFGASLSAHGCRLADARVTLRQPVADPFTVFNRPTALVRYFPRLAKGQQVAAGGLARVTVRRRRADRTGLPVEWCDARPIRSGSVIGFSAGSAHPRAVHRPSPTASMLGIPLDLGATGPP
jgi:hypothetical protein